MPNGPTHLKHQNRGLPFVALFGLLSLFFQPIIYPGILLGYIMGYVMDPDLDMVGFTKAEGLMLKRLGILAWPWLSWWLGYALVIRSLGGHRSWASHFPIVSTVLRILWLYLGISLSWRFVWSDWPPWTLTILFEPAIIGIVVGLSLADAIHIVADFYPKWQRR